MDEIRIARLEGKDLKFFKRLKKLDLLIIYDFGMKTIEGEQQNDFEKSYLNHAQSEWVSTGITERVSTGKSSFESNPNLITK